MKKISSVKKFSKKDLKEIGNTKEVVENLLEDSKEISKYRKKLFNVLYGDNSKVYGLSKSIKKNTNRTLTFFQNKVDEAYENYKKDKTAENKELCLFWMQNYERYLNSVLKKTLNQEDSAKTL